MSSNPTITLGVQSGAKTPASKPSRTSIHSESFYRQCRGPYSPEVDEFSLVLRIDGDIDHWEQEG